VSPDSVDPIRRFRDKYDLGFTLLADEDHAVAERYGVWVQKNLYGKKSWGVQRATFIIDRNGDIAEVFGKVSPATHDELVLGAL
jgi:peroxiredoxin Q/BCP